MPIAATNATLLLSRILLCLLFVWGGWGKLMASAATQAYIAHSGLPVPLAAYAVSVLVELGGGLLILFGLLTRPAALVLAGWSVITALLFHTDFADRNMQIHFLKNMGLAGGMLALLVTGAGAWSVDALLPRSRVRPAAA